MKSYPKAGQIYRHFKGGFYRVLAVTVDADGGESRRVSYCALNKDDGVQWARSY